jgi:hypothetical protein
MRRHLTLVRLFWQHLVRRKSLWVVVALVGGAMLIDLVIQSQVKGMLEDGIRYDIATRRAAATLDQYVSQIRSAAVFVVLLVGALIAPAARKEGTTQFVLTLSVSRLQLALAQFGALALLISLGAFVVHAGYCVAAYRLGILKVPEAFFGWVVLGIPLLLLATTSFALSLTRPALVVYAVLLGVPYLVAPLLNEWVGSWTTRVPETLRFMSARLVDNLGLLFPDPELLIVWPRLWAAVPQRPPYPSWGLETLHHLAAVALWIAVGLWAYRRHDFGSRIPTK